MALVCCSAQIKAHQYAACLPQLSELARTARTDPGHAGATLYLGATYLERGRFLEAEELLTPWLEAGSWTPADRSWALGYLAVSYAARRRFRSAAGALARAAELAAAAGPAPPSLHTAGAPRHRRSRPRRRSAPTARPPYPSRRCAAPTAQPICQRRPRVHVEIPLGGG